MNRTPFWLNVRVLYETSPIVLQNVPVTRNTMSTSQPCAYIPSLLSLVGRLFTVTHNKNGDSITACGHHCLTVFFVKVTKPYAFSGPVSLTPKLIATLMSRKIPTVVSP